MSSITTTIINIGGYGTFVARPVPRVLGTITIKKNYEIWSVMFILYLYHSALFCKICNGLIKVRIFNGLGI